MTDYRSTCDACLTRKLADEAAAAATKAYRVLPPTPINSSDDRRCPWCRASGWSLSQFRNQKVEHSGNCRGRRRFWLLGPMVCPTTVVHKHCDCESCGETWLELVPMPEPDGTISAT